MPVVPSPDPDNAAPSPDTAATAVAMATEGANQLMGLQTLLSHPMAGYPSITGKIAAGGVNDWSLADHYLSIFDKGAKDISARLSPASRPLFDMSSAGIRDDFEQGLAQHTATQAQAWQSRKSNLAPDRDGNNVIGTVLDARLEDLTGSAGGPRRRIPHVTVVAEPPPAEAPPPVFPTELDHVGDLGFKQYLAVNASRTGTVIKPTDAKTNKLITIVSASPDGLAHQNVVDDKGHSITRYLNARTGEVLGDVDLTSGGSWKLKDGVTRVRVDVLPAYRDLDKVQIMQGADVLAYLADREGYDWDKAVHDRSPLDKARARADFAQMNHWVDYLSGQPDQPGYDQFARQRVTGTGGRLYTNAAYAGVARPDEWTQSFVDYGLLAHQIGGGSHSIMGRASMGFGPIPETPIPVQGTPYPRGPYLFANQAPEDEVRPPNIIPNRRLLTMDQRDLIYVVLKDGTLVTGKNRRWQGHIDLAQGKPVMAAGEFGVYNGKLKFINNASGHYQPHGEAAQAAAQAAFRKAGFDVDGKYTEKDF